ncbi:Cephalosporin-C deacetylase [Streptomyces malaysiensis subsp. malaysiensis]|nr:Cephalosporin-C deacetylase [Streptomyces sp. M56]
MIGGQVRDGGRMAGYRSAEFSGFGGHRIRGRLLVPRDAAGPLPCVVQCLGYNSGRGLPHNRLLSPDYYRRLYTDEVRAVEAARQHPPVEVAGRGAPMRPVPALGEHTEAVRAELS